MHWPRFYDLRWRLPMYPPAIYTLFRLVLSHVEYFLGNGLNVLRSVENLINFPRFPFVASATTTCSLCTCRMFCELKSTDKLSERERELFFIPRKRNGEIFGALVEAWKLVGGIAKQRVHATNSQLLVALAYLTVPPPFSNPFLAHFALSLSLSLSLSAAHKQCEIFIAYFAAAATYTHTCKEHTSYIALCHMQHQIKSCINKEPNS